MLSIRKFNYSTVGTYLLSVIITRSTVFSARKFANEYLFKPIGMKHLPDYKMTIATYMKFNKKNIFCFLHVFSFMPVFFL